MARTGVRLRYRPNPTALRNVLTSSEALAYVGEAAAVVGQAVTSATPERTGYSRRSISSTARMTDKAATGYVITNSGVWHILEYGSVNRPPERPFARGVKAAGLRYEPL